MKKKDNTNAWIVALKPLGQALYKARRAARKQEWKKASCLYIQASLCCKTGGTIKQALVMESARLARLAENPPTFQPLTEENTGRYLHRRFRSVQEPYRSFYEKMGEM